MAKIKFLDQQLINMLNSFLKKSLYLLCIVIFTQSIYAQNKVDHKIAVLVNEELITSYDIIQRIKLNAILKGIEINNQNNQLLVNNTVEDLIHEKLKINKINEYNINISEEEFFEFEKNFLERNNLSKDEIMELLKLSSINYNKLQNLLMTLSKLAIFLEI